MYFTGRSLEATRQGQLTDRFTKAVDQLDRTGTDHLQARLGAIYALERLARDSPRDHPTVVEVLSAFIRTTTPQPTTVFDLSADLPGITCSEPYNVAPDIQAALTVLGRRDSTHDQTAQIDLHNTCLGNAYLSGADLTNANLRNAYLTHADLRDADLRGATVHGANLTHVDLRDANLRGATVHGANLFDADLRYADLTGADLRYANLTGASLIGADLSYANLVGAHHDEKTVIIDVVINDGTRGVWW
ncbi:pentapeptide repeat-containing protein [Saccharothrix sp.]|uniref:pentapeptide repeat-containing protein n=1 Tax=Saccharothrix sp. TaxID=1873460 RepID=UPI002811CF20|nr:pentapeptide repeat-containing protein [Saccharothrix sp.]